MNLDSKFETFEVKLKANIINEVKQITDSIQKEVKDLKEENLMLTELEGSLIAKLIIFQKIFLLPRSRWTALKDRTINVPIQDETINNFVKQLPRLPNEAGLIGLELKRKKDFLYIIISKISSLFFSGHSV